VAKLAEVERHRLLGAFSTPDWLASAVSSWAVRTNNDRILDPSYGGCAFLRALAARLSELGCTRPGERLTAVDIDATWEGCVAAEPELQGTICVTRNFLELAEQDLPGVPFDAVVGNPPYVRHHWLDEATRFAARATETHLGFRIPMTASVWAHFIAHATRFIDGSGRLGMVVPEAVLQSDYAQPLLRHLGERFASVLLVRVPGQPFRGTDEVAVVLAAEGEGPGQVKTAFAESPEQVRALLHGTAAGTSWSSARRQRPVAEEANETRLKIEQHEGTVAFSSLATVRIGLVTGANDFFIRSLRDLKSAGIPVDATLPVVERTRWLSSIRFEQDDFTALEVGGRQVRLVAPAQAHLGKPAIVSWITDGIAQGIDQRQKCSVRKPWHQVPRSSPPNAFASCSRQGSPLLVLNKAKAYCTNALHHVAWTGSERLLEAAAVAFLTSHAGLWAEMNGRRYGGVLKIEPGTLAGLRLPMVELGESAITDVDQLWRQGREPAARALADCLVLKEGLGLSTGEINTLRKAIRLLMSARLKGQRERDTWLDLR
jgi:adenine-specific DNA-methyltransferase